MFRAKQSAMTLLVAASLLPVSGQAAECSASALPLPKAAPSCQDDGVLHLLGNAIRTANTLPAHMHLGFHNVRTLAPKTGPAGQRKGANTAGRPVVCRAGLTLINDRSLLRTDTLDVRYTITPSAEGEGYGVEFTPVRARK
ncbi:hypothetical protein ACILG0_18065 [Pseudomonadota bacterium AL_CKDN230030165-1A_HGKHYDSX7]